MNKPEMCHALGGWLGPFCMREIGHSGHHWFAVNQVQLDAHNARHTAFMATGDASKLYEGSGKSPIDFECGEAVSACRPQRVRG
jgi:hypothetical protein